MKQSLEAGQIGRQEVEMFEQMMGMEVDKLVEMLDQPQARNNAQAQEILDVFKQLSELKRQS